MRTTIDLDPTVLSELRSRSRRERKSLGRLASELLAPALAAEARPSRGAIHWTTRAAGQPRVDLEDKDLLWRALEQSGLADEDP